MINRDGRLVGDSTDGAGLLEALRRGAGFDPAGRRCAVIGAGGAARAAIAALADAGAVEVVVVNRTRARAEVAAELAGSAGRVGEPRDDRRGGPRDSCDAVRHDRHRRKVASIPCSRSEFRRFFHPGQVVMDLVYVPADTPILREASEEGAETVGGIGMLVHQAALAIEHWTGSSRPPSSRCGRPRSAHLPAKSAAASHTPGNSPAASGSGDPAVILSAGALGDHPLGTPAGPRAAPSGHEGPAGIAVRLRAPAEHPVRGRPRRAHGLLRDHGTTSPSPETIPGTT